MAPPPAARLWYFSSSMTPPDPPPSRSDEEEEDEAAEDDDREEGAPGTVDGRVRCIRRLWRRCSVGSGGVDSTPTPSLEDDSLDLDLGERLGGSWSGSGGRSGNCKVRHTLDDLLVGLRCEQRLWGYQVPTCFKIGMV